MANQGNQGAARFVRAVSRLAAQQVPAERRIDFATVKEDYSLVTDSYPVPIPKGEWSTVKNLTIEFLGDGIVNQCRLNPGERVVVAWAGNEAVVIGSLTKI